MTKPEIKTYVTTDYVCNKCGTRFSTSLDLESAPTVCTNPDCKSTDIFSTGGMCDVCGSTSLCWVDTCWGGPFGGY